MTKVIFDSPNLYKGNRDYYYEGGSPKLLEEFIHFLEEKKKNIKSITISLYLYNNPKLHTYFKDLIENTHINITVISIPLEGYDNTKPQALKYLNHTSKITKEFTKLDIAKRVYDDILKLNSEQYSLFIFPHMYIRSKHIKPFSRGKMPYSLHSKLFLIEYIDNDIGDIAVSSSGLAARDLVKEENLLVIEENYEYFQATKTFFKDLISNSIEIENFDNQKEYFEYNIEICKENFSDKHIFIAPFYENSPNKSESFLIQLINNAKQRIYVVAQHISSYEYNCGKNNSTTLRKGFLYTALEKAEKTGLEIRCLSQTYVDENGNSCGCRRPANIKMFQRFIGSYKKLKNAKYAVNASVHSKYIIIDDLLIITTCNFTPTQFIYIKNVDINDFTRMPNVHFKGIHSEVGAFFVIKDKLIVEKYVDNMFDIWNHNKTKIVI